MLIAEPGCWLSVMIKLLISAAQLTINREE